MGLKYIKTEDRLPDVGQEVVATDGFEREMGFYGALDHEAHTKGFPKDKWFDFGFEVKAWFPIPTSYEEN